MGPIPSNNADNSEGGDNLEATEPVDTAAGNSTNAILSGVWCSSIFTFIQNELPALRAHLSDDDMLKAKTFVEDTLSSFTREDGAELGEFLFRNCLSVSKKLLVPVLVTASESMSYDDPLKVQLVAELARMKKQDDIEHLVQGWSQKKAVGDGIGLVDGKPVFGPRRQEDKEEIKLAPTSYLSLAGIQTMQRLATKEKEMANN